MNVTKNENEARVVNDLVIPTIGFWKDLHRHFAPHLSAGIALSCLIVPSYDVHVMVRSSMPGLNRISYQDRTHRKNES